MSMRHSLPLAIGRATAKISPGFDAAFWRVARLSKGVPLFRLEGLTKTGRPARVLVNGPYPDAEYVSDVWLAPGYRAEPLGATPPARLNARLRALRDSVDLVAVRLDRLLVRAFFHGDTEYLHWSEWIRSSLTLPKRLEDLGSLHNSMRQDLRLVRKYGYSAEVSRDPNDFSWYYQHVYRPYQYFRHGPHAHLRSEASLRAALKNGALIFICREGQRVAGSIVQCQPPHAQLASLGVAEGWFPALKQGVLAAVYYFTFKHAGEQGCETVGLGGTRPSAKDGLLYYKQKWGACLDAQPWQERQHLLYWRNANVAVLDFIDHVQPIICARNQLITLVAPGEDLGKTFAVNGVSHLETIQPESSSANAFASLCAGARARALAPSAA